MADTKPTERHEAIQFRQLLEEVVTKPGTLMKAYSMFWNYSLRTQASGLLPSWAEITRSARGRDVLIVHESQCRRNLRMNTNTMYCKVKRRE